MMMSSTSALSLWTRTMGTLTRRVALFTLRWVLFITYIPIVLVTVMVIVPLTYACRYLSRGIDKTTEM